MEIPAKDTQYGQAFTYGSLSKNGSRPIIYSAIGSHANFAVAGLHSRNISVVTVNDYTSPGPLWDPTLSAYFYTFTPSSSTNGTFIPSDTSTPTSWLFFEGRWGDEQYPDSDPVQVNFLNLNITWKYESGPTGPLDKGLNRTDVCPDVVGTPCLTLSTLPVTSGSSIPVTVTRATGSQSAVPTGTVVGNASSSTGTTRTVTGSGTLTTKSGAGAAGTSTSSGGSPTSISKGGAGFLKVNLGYVLTGTLGILLIM
jgi:hypothetical protein